jgi:hypothetical protein
MRLQVRTILTAISPLFATKIFENTPLTTAFTVFYT